MNGKIRNTCVALLLSAAVLTPLSAVTMHKSASYSSGKYNVDGGVMEIIAYNSTNNHAYSVNGQSGVLAALDLSVLGGNGSCVVLSGEDIDIKSLVENEDPSFNYGDMTSVAVSPDGNYLALALQAEAYNEPGRIAIFRCDEDGLILFEGLIESGVQPDMIIFADNNTVLTADEGEPREGYGKGIDDPEGSVTIAYVDSMTSVQVGFESFDTDSMRSSLVVENIVIMKDRLPSEDFEPEYIAVSGTKAYITLQEANAIAVLDIPSASFTGIYSAGFEDYSKTVIDINKKDEAYVLMEKHTLSQPMKEMQESGVMRMMVHSTSVRMRGISGMEIHLQQVQSLLIAVFPERLYSSLLQILMGLILRKIIFLVDAHLLSMK